MGFWKGRLTIRRYRIHEPVEDGFRDDFERRLQESAFRERRSANRGEETVGWVLPDNLLDTDFDLRDRWLFDHYLVIGLRIDKTVLPSQLLRAHLDQRIVAWEQENNQSRCPASVRTDIRTALEAELLARSLPQVKMVPICWHLGEGWVAVHSTATRVNDTFRTLFRTTFGVVPEPFSPIDFLEADPVTATEMASSGMTDFSQVSP